MLGSYYKIDSDIHKLNPLLKIVDLILFIVAMLLTNNLYVIGILILFLLMIILLTNVPLILYLKTIMSLKSLILFILIVNYFSNISMINTLISIIKIISVIMCSNILIYTTTPTNITKGLNNLLKPLEKFGIKVSVISLMISLALRFIPMLLETGKKIINNLKLRNIDDKKYIIKALVFPLFIITLKKSDNISEVMSLKNYDINKKCKYSLNYHYLDYLFTLIHVILLIVVFVR